MRIFLAAMAAAIVTSSYIPQDYQDLCYEIAPECGMEPEIMVALIETESSGQADAISADGKCIGLCQLNSDYFDGDLYDPETNIRMGCGYLTDLYARYGNMAAALMGYHGEYHPLEKAESGNISGYARKIMERAEELKNESGYSDDACSDPGLYSGISDRICGGNNNIEEPQTVEKKIQGRIQSWPEEWNDLWYSGMLKPGREESFGFWECACSCF